MILGIETATAEGEVALLDSGRAGRLLGESSLEGGGQRHAAGLLLTIDALLKQAGRSLDEVEGIAVSIGPGAFTSLRIGLSTALGLCFGTSRWIAPVPTLAALASLAPSGDAIVPMLDARKGQVYTAVYASNGAARTQDCVVSPQEWLESLGGDAYCLVGPGVATCREPIDRVLGSRAQVVDARPTAAAVARLGARLAAEGKVQDPGDVELRYVRAPDLGTP